MLYCNSHRNEMPILSSLYQCRWWIKPDLGQSWGGVGIGVLFWLLSFLSPFFDLSPRHSNSNSGLVACSINLFKLYKGKFWILNHHHLYWYMTNYYATKHKSRDKFCDHNFFYHHLPCSTRLLYRCQRNRCCLKTGRKFQTIRGRLWRDGDDEEFDHRIDPSELQLNLVTVINV